jgi:hypothetical protein
MVTKMKTCTTCGRVREYPFCLDKFHDEPPPNPMLDALNPILDKLGRFQI